MTPRPNPLMPLWAREYPGNWLVVRVTGWPTEWLFGSGFEDIRVHADLFFRCPWFRMRDVHGLVCDWAVRNLR